MDAESLWMVLAAILGPSGAAYMGVKVGLNGLKKEVAEIKEWLSMLDQRSQTHGERLASLETSRESDR